jgi:hypothetical protein
MLIWITRAFSSEVYSGSREENASKYKLALREDGLTVQGN